MSRRVGSGGRCGGGPSGEQENKREEEEGGRFSGYILSSVSSSLLVVVFFLRGQARFDSIPHTIHTLPPALFAFRSHYLPYNNARRTPPGAIYTCHVYR